MSTLKKVMGIRESKLGWRFGKIRTPNTYPLLLRLQGFKKKICNTKISLKIENIMIYMITLYNDLHFYKSC